MLEVGKNSNSSKIVKLSYFLKEDWRQLNPHAYGENERCIQQPGTSVHNYTNQDVCCKLGPNVFNTITYRKKNGVLVSVNINVQCMRNIHGLLSSKYYNNTINSSGKILRVRSSNKDHIMMHLMVFVLVRLYPSHFV